MYLLYVRWCFKDRCNTSRYTKNVFLIAEQDNILVFDQSSNILSFTTDKPGGFSEHVVSSPVIGIQFICKIVLCLHFRLIFCHYSPHFVVSVCIPEQQIKLQLPCTDSTFTLPVHFGRSRNKDVTLSAKVLLTILSARASRFIGIDINMWYRYQH